MGKDQDLIQAVKDNDVTSVSKIIQKLAKTSKTKIIGNNKKLNINFQDGDGMSALHQASLMGSTDVIKLLVEAGASSDLRDNKGMVALHYATWQGRPEPVQALLQKQPPVNEQALNGETPLHLACQHGHIHVVKLLLTHHADPTICNKELKTPLDLACEFGRYRVVEQLLRSNLCEKLLEDSPIDTLDNSRTTCLHLAAKNGHSDIIRLLIQNGMNINRATLSGTCLHEAALYGKTDVVKLLLDCGIDVNKPNSYDQTALDIVNKFTTSRAGRELKQLLKEASFAVQARAVKDYFNVYDPHSLAFKEGDIITVLEQRGDGQWKGYVVQEGKMAKTGIFPANHVVLVDGQALKQQHQTKGPQVPDLLSRGPHFNHNGHLYHNGFGPGSDTTSTSSSSTDDSYPPAHITAGLGPLSTSPYPSYGGPPPPSPGHNAHGVPPPGTGMPQSPAHNAYGVSQGPGFNSCGVPPTSPGYHSTGHPPFGSGGPPPSPGGYLPTSSGLPFGHHKDIHETSFSSQSTVLGSQHSPYIVNKPGGLGGDHGSEWLGVGGAGPGLVAGGDMRAHSPGKDHVQHNNSPAHSNRNSAASSDSGRGVSTGHLEPKVVTVIGQHRLSDQSYESGVSSRQSYHSTSSSSLGSLDRLEESGHVSTINVQQLIQAGVPDKEVLHAWLHDLRFEDYYSNFMQAGYDMPTISRMTPEDLTAIGITKPAHRKRLKAEIARLHIHDGIPDFCPHDLIEWLHLLGLGMYHETLAGQGYDNIEYVTDITWEDLEEIGIKKLGHQKKIMLAIDRLKRITSASKRLSTAEPRRSSIEMLEPPPPAPPIGRWSGEISALPPHMYEGGLGVGAKPKKSPSGDSISTTGSGGSGSNSSHSSGEMRAIPLPREDAGISGGMPYSRQPSISSSSSGGHSDVVAIQVKRQGRSSTSEDSREVGGQQALYQSFQGPVGGKGGSGEFPVTYPMSTSDPGVGIQMAPRVQPKPVAKIIAKTKRSSRENSPDAEMEKHECENNSDGNKGGPVLSSSMPTVIEDGGDTHSGGTLKRGQGAGQLRVEIRDHIYDQPQSSPSGGNTPSSPKPQLTAKSASPLHVATHHNPSVPSSGSPTGRSKKAPPPPPKRTHSIRNDSAPSTVSKAETTNSFSVTTTASVGSASTTTPSSNNERNSSNTPASSAAQSTAAKQESTVTEKTQPQTEAFASCVKSLSERFGSKKSEIDGSQESLSSDSDDFPPPPPPIAMDIITPKIHNYGIPSKSDMHHSPLHVREYGMHSHHPPGGFQSRLKTLQSSDGGSARSDPHCLSASVPPLRRLSPGRDIPATSMHHDRSRDLEAHSLSSNLSDKRSESTTSFESTASTSSTDSNTLPFANENVGTIKQRAAAMKPSIVQTLDSGDGQRNVDLNVAMFDCSMGEKTGVDVHRTKTCGATEGMGALKGVNGHGVGQPRMVSAGSGGVVVNNRGGSSAVPHNTHTQTVTAASSKPTETVPSNNTRMSQKNCGASPEGSVRPPVPGKKPTLVPVSPQPQQHQKQQQQKQTQQQSVQQQPKPEVQGSQPQKQQNVQSQAHQQQQPPSQISQQPPKPASAPQKSSAELSVPVETAPPQRKSSDVLSDIDNMLQGLTDELDAMLLEETDG